MSEIHVPVPTGCGEEGYNAIRNNILQLSWRLSTMKYLSVVLLMLLLLMLAGCSGCLTKVPEGDRIIRLNKELPGKTQEEIFSAAEQWMEETFTVLADPIQLVIPEEGVIVGRNQIPYPFSALSAVTRGGWLVVFEMQVNATDGVIQTVFREIALISPPSAADPLADSGMLSPVWSQRDLATIRPQLVQLNEDLTRAVASSR
jgi:hypothetical protein